MLDAIRRILEAEPAVAYALVFGSTARGTERPDSDADVAVELTPGAARDVHALGCLTARLMSAAGRPVDLVLLDEAPAPLAYRIFRDGPPALRTPMTSRPCPAWMSSSSGTTT